MEKQEMIDALKAELNAFGDKVDQKIEKANGQAQESVDGIEKTLKTEIENMSKKYLDMEEQLSQIEAEHKRTSFSGGIKSFRSILSDSIGEQKEKFQSYRNDKKPFSVKLDSFSFSRKAADMTQANALTGDVIPPTRVPGFIFDPDRAEAVRDIMASGTTNSNTVYYVQETAYDDGTSTVAEADTKPQSDFDLEQKSADVKKIATYMRVSEELFDDLPGLTSYLAARVPRKLSLVEDNQILYGNNTGANLQGITTVATAYDNGYTDSNINRFDVLVSAIRQARVDEYYANYIMLHPEDVQNLVLTKDADGNYLMPDSVRTGNVLPRVKGVPIFETTAITAGDFLVGDFALGAQVFDRMQSQIRFFEQDQDNAITNQVTIVAEERLAVPIYRPSAFVYDNFDAALANGSA